MYSALRTSIIDEKVRRGLRHALIIEIDDTIKDILAYVILHEPVTLYNISKNTRYAISTVYKKAKRMLYYELIKPSLYWVDENGKRRHVYTATVKGLLVCLAYNCLDDEIVLNRLRSKWGLRNYDIDKMISLLAVIPHIVRRDNTKILENMEALMIVVLNAVLNDSSIISKALDEITVLNVRNTSIHYVLNSIVMSNLGQAKRPDIIIGNNSYLVGYCKNDNTFFVYMCRLCGKNCLLTNVPYNSRCQLITELTNDIANIVR